MVKKELLKLFFSVFCISVLIKNYLVCSETITRPLSFMAGIGFEETNTKWSSSSASYHYEHIKFLLFELAGSSMNRNILVEMGGSYGVLGTGELENTLLTHTQFSPTRGTLADTFFLLGYLIPITPDRLTVTYLTPEGGYRGDWLTLHTSSTRCKELWYGPFLGASLEVNTNEGMALSLTYHYHWLNLHQTMKDVLNSSVKIHLHHAYGHEAQLKLQTYLFQKIRLGASLHYFYYREAHCSAYNTEREDLSISLQYIYDF